MKTPNVALQSKSGSALMVVLMLITTTSLMIGAVLMMTTGEARFMKRSLDRDVAIAYADGVIDDLFDQWRTIIASSSLSQTDKRYGPKGSDLTGTYGITITSTGTSSIHVPPTNMSLTSWGLTASDPYGNPLASGSRPTLENGTNSSLLIRMYYVATATVSFPHGSVTVQRIFTRAGTNIFNNFLYSAQPVTELDPGATMSVNGTIFAGGNLYLNSSNLTLMQDVSYTGSMSTNLAPGNNEGAPSGTPTWPTTDPPHAGVSQNLIDVVTSELDTNFVSSGGYYDPGVYSSTNSITQDLNNKGYHELIETASGTGSGQADPLQLDTTGDNERLSSNADYTVTVDGSNNVKVYKGSATSGTQITSSLNATEYNAIVGALTTNTAFYDGRVGDTVRAVTLDVGKITTAYNAGTLKDSNNFEGTQANDGLLLYVQDLSAVNATITSSGATVSGSSVSTNNYNYNVTTSGTSGLHTTSLSGTNKAVTSSFARGVRLVNGGNLPASNSTNVTGGLTIASPNPVYIQGDWNTGSTYSGSFSSNGMTYSSTPSSDGTNAYPSGTSTPTWTSGSYTEQPSVIAADAVTILSNGWSDSTSNSSLTSRTPLNTTINTAIVAGNVPTAFVVSHFSVGTDYSGGIENFPRLLENWSGYNLTIHGSFALLYNSLQAVQPWQPTTNYYNAPNRRWFFDSTLQNYNPPGFPAAYTYTRGKWMTK